MKVSSLRVLLVGGLLSLVALGPARADVIHLTSGGRVRGKIVKETRREVVVETRGGTTSIPRDEIDRIERGATLEDQYRERLKKIDPKDPEARYSLGQWLKSQGEPRLAKVEFERTIALDPEHRFAREQLGYVRHEGEWVLSSSLEASAPSSSKSAPSKAEQKEQAPARFETPSSPELAAALETARRGKTAAERAAAFDVLADREAEGARILALLGGEGQARLRAALSKHAPEAAQASGDALRPYVAGYVAEVVAPAVDRALEQHLRTLARAQDRGVKRAAGLFKEPGLFKGQVEDKRGKALERWATVRDAALKVIFDKSIYPDENHGRVGQPTVDEHVEKVRAAWAPFDRMVQKDLAKLLTLSSDEAQDLLAKLSAPAELYAEAAGRARARGLEVEELAAAPVGLLCLLRYQAGQVPDALALAERLDAWEQELLRRVRDERVRAYNRGFKQKNPCSYGVKPAGEEVEQVRITNDYRIMMGRAALEIDPRLVKSARGHAADMTRLGFFDHTSPVAGKRSPSERMAQAGYPGYGGENISLGSVAPMATHLAWYNSSGHHRNILAPDYWAMGAGQDGQHWTQNFGQQGTLIR
ncbi:MAG: CAP domain-containing protein [Planctomycetota bacterium]